MPFVKSGNNYISPSGRKFTKKQVAMYYATNGFTKKKKPSIVVNNKLKGVLGESEFKKGNIPTGKVMINVKRHHGDTAELASTIKHELLHVQHPNMTEKEVYKRSAKTKIPPQEQSKLLAKLRMKSLNYKTGAIKRKMKIARTDTVETGDLITKANEMKANARKVAIMGLV